MKPLVSVIVPVYKVEPYLERCLDSLADQTLKEIEIIVIDDGSPDRCGEICDAYAAKDARFRVVHQENCGLSAARNVGIELAQADYLMFVDSDDWVHPDYCRLPYEAAVEHGAELVMFQYRRIEKEKERLWLPDEPEGIKSQDDGIRILFQGAGMVAWNKLYHNRLFREIRFPEGRFFEDNAVAHRIVYSAQKIFFLRCPLYYYVIREGSITRSKDYKKYKDRYEMVSLLCSELVQLDHDEIALRLMRPECYRYLLAEGRHREHSRECISFLLYQDPLRNQSTRNRRIMMWLLRYAPPLFDLVCILWGKRIR